MNRTAALSDQKAGLCFYALCMMCTFSGYAQESVLKFNDQKNYKLYIVDVSKSNNINYRIDSIKNFFIVRWDDKENFRVEDKKNIEELKKSWTAVKSEEVSFCWYDYLIYVLENDQIVDELRVSEQCRQVVSYRGAYKYANSILPGLPKNNTLSVARLDFKSVAFGRTFFKDAKTRTGISIPPGPHDEWLTYDGKLTIAVEKGDTVKTVKHLTQELQKKFPGDTFEIKPSGTGFDYLLYTLYCNQTLAEKLDGLNIFSKWTELNAGTLTLLGASEKTIQNLVKEYASLKD